MVGLPRLLILFAVVSTLGAILAKYWILGLHAVAVPGGWLRFTNTLLFFAIALLLEQMLAVARAKKAQ